MERERVDVIVVDYAMPRCDGEEFARRFRERYAPPGVHPPAGVHLAGERAVPLVLVTASHQVHERCSRVAADGCLGKPFDVDKLIQVVDQQTHSHAAA